MEAQMIDYSHNKNSGVRIAILHEDSIDIIFRSSNKVYSYHADQIGMDSVQSLHVAARKGKGLNSKLNEIRKAWNMAQKGITPA